MQPFPTMPWTSAAVVGTVAVSTVLDGVSTLRRRLGSAVGACGEEPGDFAPREHAPSEVTR